MKTIKLKNKNSAGFVILFAITLSSIILSVALGVANVAFREVSFSISARDANDAFLAADTGAECALLHDKLVSGSFPIEGPATEINCAGSPVTPTFTGTDDTGTYDFVIPDLGSSSTSCAKVRVFKDKSESPMLVVVTSTGYNIGDTSCNSTNPRRVERQLLVSSKVSAPPTYAPPDESVSLECPACSQPVSYGGSVSLNWTTVGVTSCNASGGSGSDWTTEPAGSTKTWPTGNQELTNLTSTQTYTISCTSPDGGIIVNDSVEVVVNPTSYTVLTSTNPSEGGVFDHVSQSVNEGDPATFQVTPNNNYTITQVTGCGGSLNGNTYTIIATWKCR